MQGKNIRDFVIIGNGVAGISAALVIRENSPSARITIISRETQYYYSRTALMYIAMGIMTFSDTEPYERDFYRARGINLIYGNVTHIDTKNKLLIMEKQETIPYDILLIATGATVASCNWPGLELQGVTGFISYQDCKNIIRLIKTRRHAVVVGGGLIGIELCEVFRHYNIDVTFLIRGPSYWHKALSPGEGKYVEKHIATHGVEIITGDELVEIHGKNGFVEYITTKGGKRVPCDIVGLATGVRPEITLAQQAGISCNKGILTNPSLQTNMEDIFAAGDCAEIQFTDHHFMEAVWYCARDMGKIAGSAMLGNSLTYDPGVWYNSAKFFEKEYTVVGRYGILLEGETEYLYQDNKQSVRIVLENNTIKGFSMIGSRWDHLKLLEFIREKRDLDYFLIHYKDAQFNPELQSYPILHNRNRT